MSSRKASLQQVETRIGYHFEHPEVLQRALTHVSALQPDAAQLGGDETGSYERLEYLGDRVLGLAVASMLFEAFPEAAEGELSQRLAVLVRKETCAEVALALDLGSAIRLGPSEASGGGRKKSAILADACEAVIGAVFLDGGYEAARGFVDRAWRELMLRPPRALRDPKTTLQEWAQARGLNPPQYQEIARSGPDHRPEFKISVIVEGLVAAEGQGSSKRIAEQAAAAALLQREKLAGEARDAG